MTKVTLENINSLVAEYSSYKKTFSKYGVDPFSVLYSCGEDSVNNRYNIELTQNYYYKDGRKNFPKKPSTTETKNISGLQFLNYVSSIPFFKDRVTMGYTPMAYTVTRIVAVNPYDNNTKVERIFHITVNE